LLCFINQMPEISINTTLIPKITKTIVSVFIYLSLPPSLHIDSEKCTGHANCECQ
jgi:hypothetical protein